jgi:hypothetical protein
VTEFTFEVTYLHSSGLSPQSALVYIDGEAHSMSQQSGTPATGAVFATSMALEAGAHEYYFVFNDGQTSYPDPFGPASFKGPEVS